MNQIEIRSTGFSDSVFLESALAPAVGHFPMSAVFNLVGICASTVLLHLNMESPIRGGIDVALGLQMEGHAHLGHGEGRSP